MNNEVKFIERGWECPKCGAVMAPHVDVCINCRGNGSGSATSVPSLDNLFIHPSDATIPHWANTVHFEEEKKDK